MECMLLFLTAVIVLVVTILYMYTHWQYQYFKRNGIKSSPTMKIPFLGHFDKVFFGNKHFKDTIGEGYRAFPNEKYYGFFDFANPVIVIRDLELIKQITVKDFDSFHDHNNFLDWDSDPLFSKNLFSLKGQKWREMRPTLSPAFTSSKMRGMYEFIVECGEQCTSYFQDLWQKEKNANGVLEVEMRDPFKRFSGNVIASCAFGYKIDAFKERDNAFYKMAAGASEFTSVNMFFILLYFIKSKFYKSAESSAFTEDVRSFYRNLVKGAMEERERKNIHRPDMIHLLMQAKKGKLHSRPEDNAQVTESGFATVNEYATEDKTSVTKWTDDELTAQAIIFIIGGFDTSSQLMTYMAYELAVNPGIQKKLQDEIDDAYQRCNGKVTYNELHVMKYMDMTISETLRRWGQAFRLDRKCVKEYELPPPNSSTNKRYKVKPGDAIWIPSDAIHHDPQYYPNPYKFDPERFSDENKNNINPLTYLPFGVGPRNCIGSRFALMETKAVMFHILLKFDVVTTSKTPIPLALDPKTLSLTIKGGCWVGLKPRNK